MKAILQDVDVEKIPFLEAFLSDGIGRLNGACQRPHTGLPDLHAALLPPLQSSSTTKLPRRLPSPDDAATHCHNKLQAQVNDRTRPQPTKSAEQTTQTMMYTLIYIRNRKIEGQGAYGRAYQRDQPFSQPPCYTF